MQLFFWLGEFMLSFTSSCIYSECAEVPKAQREAAGITDGLIRFSPGLEDINDLKDDLSAALDEA